MPLSLSVVRTAVSALLRLAAAVIAARSTIDWAARRSLNSAPWSTANAASDQRDGRAERRHDSEIGACLAQQPPAYLPHFSNGTTHQIPPTRIVD